MFAMFATCASIAVVSVIFVVKNGLVQSCERAVHGIHDTAFVDCVSRQERLVGGINALQVGAKSCECQPVRPPAWLPARAPAHPSARLCKVRFEARAVSRFGFMQGQENQKSKMVRNVIPCWLKLGPNESKSTPGPF